GTTLTAAGVAVDAAVRSVSLAAGVGTLTVRGPVRALLYTSGDEIVSNPSPGAPLPRGTVPDTASAPVAELLAQYGLTVSSGEHLDDTPVAFREALGTPGTDLVVVIGATGHGVADHLRAALTDAGAQILIDGLAVRPGGSLLVAQLPSGAVLLGLGGNPLAAVAGTAVLVPAIVDALLARTPRTIELLDVVDGDEARLPGRWRVLPAEPDGAGRWSVTRGRGTGHLASTIGYRALVLVPPRELTGAYQRL
ncbi:MAG: molybdopterin-binding protein, partial [Gordonia sp. (in: high G+C Gram-positive bacteria)]|uniref:molybdopterin-binding protein n=1 Tax=Gordonia sp. (in: high G+C Gram-positive bacteria) TaxID=84139 RepID=UPI003BB58F45